MLLYMYPYAQVRVELPGFRVFRGDPDPSGKTQGDRVEGGGEGGDFS